MQGFVDQVDVDFLVDPKGEMAKNIAEGRFTVEPAVGFDPGLLRPVIQNDGKKYCKIRTGRTITKNGQQVPETKHVPLGRLISNGTVPHTYNATSLPYETWQRIDRAVIKASRDRLNAWNDLAAANTYSGFDGMATTGLVRDTMTDAGSAKVDMDTISDDFGDQPLFTPDILPLPIIHAGTYVSERRLAQSRNAGTPLDTTMIEQCGRRCAETLEAMTIGTTDFSGLVIGSSSIFTNRGIFGFRTHSDRITKTDVTAAATSFAAGSGEGGATFVTEVIAMIELARAQKFYGPFVLYYSTTWDPYLKRDYYRITTSGATSPEITVRQRVENIDGIQRVAMLDTFTNASELLLVQMTSETVRAVDGLDWTTVQWVEQGGARNMLRVMGIKVPDLRSQYVGTSTSSRKCGIVHGTTS